MSLIASRGKMQRLTKDLMLQWERTNESWQDPVSQRFENEYLTPLGRAVLAAGNAMDSMNEVVTRARRDCE